MRHDCPASGGQGTLYSSAAWRYRGYRLCGGTTGSRLTRQASIRGNIVSLPVQAHPLNRMPAHRKRFIG